MKESQEPSTDWYGAGSTTDNTVLEREIRTVPMSDGPFSGLVFVHKPDMGGSINPEGAEFKAEKGQPHLTPSLRPSVIQRTSKT